MPREADYWQRPPEWMIVRRSRTIIGGYRVVQSRLTEEQAQRRAALYKRPHEAMSLERLREIRIAALKAREADDQ